MHFSLWQQCRSTIEQTDKLLWQSSQDSSQRFGCDGV